MDDHFKVFDLTGIHLELDYCSIIIFSQGRIQNNKLLKKIKYFNLSKVGIKDLQGDEEGTEINKVNIIGIIFFVEIIYINILFINQIY